MFGHSKFGVKVSENDGTMTLALQGIIETSTAEAFETEMAAACSKSKNLIADFDKVNYGETVVGDNHVGLVGDFIKLLLGHCPPRRMLSVARKFSGRCKGLQG